MHNNFQSCIFKCAISFFCAVMIIICVMPIIPVTATTNYSSLNSGSVIVSLGDSYSAGEGIEPYYDQDLPVEEKIKSHDWLAHRSQKSWPSRLKLPYMDGTLADNDEYWYFTAVSGATTEHLTKSQVKQYNQVTFDWAYRGEETLAPQLDIFERIGENQTRYVTITMGGNDAGFADIIIKAATTGKYLFPNALTKMLNEIDVDAICAKLMQAYKDIEATAGPQAHIIVAGYPKLLAADGGGLFNKNEATLINSKVVFFNSEIERIVDECASSGMKISFVSVLDAFEGHEAYTEEPYIFGVELHNKQDISDTSVASSKSMHPNEVGAEAYARCVQMEINRLEGLPIIVSLGDSYSAGEGIEPYYDQNLPIEEKVQSHDWLAHRSQNSWPGMLQLPYIDGNMSDYRDMAWFFTAVSGAETCHMLEEQPVFYYQGIFNYGTQLLTPQLDVFNYIAEGQTRYVTITMGGNDAGFVDIITKAATTGEYFFPNALQKKLDEIDVDEICDKLIAAYEDIEEAAGKQAHIIVAGYPRLISPEGGGPFNKDEALLINNKVSDFNIKIKEAIQKCRENGMNIYFVSVENAFLGHGAYSADPYIIPISFHNSEDISDISPISSASMHPNSLGVKAYAECVQAKINQIEENSDEWIPEVMQPVTSDERDIVLVLDNSGSMAGTPISETRKASENFIKTILKEDASIGVVAFESEANMLSNFSMDEAQLLEAVRKLYASGGTNTLAGLTMADEMLSQSNAKKKIIVLMSDGMPSNSKSELIEYAKELRKKGIIIYTLGFFGDVGDQKVSAQSLMENLADAGHHYEVADADNLVYFFGDIADQISGQQYIYIRIACPVEVTVKYNGETLCSDEKNLNTRTDFGSLTFEERDDGERVKILRLKQGAEYDIRINGTDEGRMNYTIGLMNENGEYSDVRRFYNVKITDKTVINTIASESRNTVLEVDEDGDGKLDIRYKAGENSRGEKIKNGYTWWIVSPVVIVVVAFSVVIVLKKKNTLKRKVDE